MNKAELLEALEQLKITNSCTVDYDKAIDDAIDLIEDLTCITDPEFPAVIKEPLPMRDYGVLYLVLDGADGMWYVTRQDKVIYHSRSDKIIERLWALAVNEYYPETREEK